ncbi:tannase [Fusarium albosuccineum]|uniref:Carboxylic ester hydrolase n=1 Tax=Fusarium albosuccineum TaxID=1237068 RepID=A0A8H4PJU7_9HYPO|nr:tannase [Fusarium albosuccineum]
MGRYKLLDSFEKQSKLDHFKEGIAQCIASAKASTLADVCKTSHIRSALPTNGTLLGIDLLPSTVTAKAVYNGTVGMDKTQSYTYCDVSISYTHTGKDDKVTLKYAFPSPSDFKTRFYVAYGAAGGATDAGYDGFDTSYDEEGCSDGGREGMSQVQRWGELYDGVIAGAPAFRFAQQQVLHVLSSAVEHTLDYYPPPCELAKIVNATISACDPLDGRTDGVVSRTDLCKLNFDLKSIIGESYYCAEKNNTSLGFGFNKRQAPGSTTSYQPEQNGTVSAEGVKVAQAIYDGLFNSKGERAYLSWQIASELGDATTEYDEDSESWTLSIPSTGGEYVTKFIQLLDLDNLSDLDGVTYDTLVEWMNIGMIRFGDSLQTTLPDLTTFKSNGGKLLHYHGESDSSIPAASSVHYWQSVRSIMKEDSLAEFQEWYQFCLVPGAGHCGANSLQPGPYPQNNMNIMIDWVENGVQPKRLNATVSSGDNEGETQMLCQWPTRPLWHSNNSEFDCVSDKASIESWTYELDAFKLPVY